MRKLLKGVAVLLITAFLPGALAQSELELWFTGTAAQMEVIRAAVDEYNQLQDNVRITLTETPPSRERIATALASGQGPDIMYYNHNMPWFFGIEAVYPINDFVMDPEIGIDADQIFPATREATQYAGVVQAVPIASNPGGLIYNRGIFREAGLSDEDAPTTWEEVEELAIRLTQRDGDRVTRWGIVNSSIDWMLQELLLSNGGDWVNEDATEYIECPECLVEGLQWWHDLHHVHGVMPMPQGVTWTGTEAMQVGHEAFIRGDAAMVGFMGLSTAAAILDQNPELDLAAVITPLGPSSGGERTISPGFDGLFVMATAADPREAYLFNKWFFEEKALEFVRVTPGQVPASTAALADPEFQNSPYYGFGQVLEAMETADLRSFHVFPGRLDVRAQEPAMAESVLLGRATPQEAVDRFLQHAQQVFDLYGPDLEEFRGQHAIVW